MHPYLTHLLADITAAHRTETLPEEKRPLSFEEEMEEIDNWLEGEEPSHTFGYYCGLDAINFPPPEQLNDTEIKLVLEAFGKMMYSWNLDIDLPELLPLHIAYSMTVATLDEKTGIVNNGMMSIDFCTCYAPDCVFKEYCPCLEIWNEVDDDININDAGLNENELPF